MQIGFTITCNKCGCETKLTNCDKLDCQNDNIIKFSTEDHSTYAYMICTECKNSLGVN